MSKKHQKNTGWTGDVAGVPLLLVSSVGTTLPGTDRKYRSHVPDPDCPGMLTITKKQVCQPVVVAFWRLIFHVIDGLNRQRTGTIAMRDIWRTQSWEHRDFGELFMMIIVNAENAWKYFDPLGIELKESFLNGQKVNPRVHFLTYLCYDLFHNPFLTESDKITDISAADSTPQSRDIFEMPGTSAPRPACPVVGEVPSNVHVPVTVEGQNELSVTSVADFMSHHCVPQPLPSGTQERCGVPDCEDGVLNKKTGKTSTRGFKTSVKCGRCHLKGPSGKEFPAFVCSPLSGRTCWIKHNYAARARMWPCSSCEGGQEA
ncbi:hypothetical protein CYMTET_45752 [Cymbomonas tetramitiformis]|uniref:Uncharacterized protein n=1 Tax=Cymbomonas tetramitiformis TaxID=36881 RepID=A0AAE0EYA7_9CHLO|nr:hypothetical protein CYMTET_45752 [Cymbomonas tetramitiformis]